MIIQSNFAEDINVGLYGFATDKCCIIGSRINDKKLKDAFNVPLIQTTALDTQLVKIFIAGNSSGIIVPKILEEFELDFLRQKFDDVLVIDNRYTALGNLILMNDNGIIVSPLLKNHKNIISERFGLPCETSTIAKANTVGTLGLATNKGCLVHPKIRDDEKRKIKDVLKVGLKEATVNFGSVHVGAGIIANSHGAAVGSATSGYEIGAINECLKVS
ncbi:MAG: translation initiation factor IF-6 [Candidatus Aenigmarchaeota archaeon]|nr:translation initiation factor IF-6 [Candidatus Aenigmarchaeota archaeon]